MIFKPNKHKPNLYNILLILSRNIFFYNKTDLPDTFETRIYLMFFHFSILMIVTKKKGSKFDQKSYDLFFNNIEYNLRELGFGDVTVNKKMKELNKILYDILLKIEEKKNNKKDFEISPTLINKYLKPLKDEKSVKIGQLNDYFLNFFNFCFELSLENMLEGCIKFEY
tara:strand:+ start:308 stop:811 length:504 start_codon:yes stop_codon:yes gene_type:complete